MASDNIFSASIPPYIKHLHFYESCLFDTETVLCKRFDVAVAEVRNILPACCGNLDQLISPAKTDWYPVGCVG